ncbi:transposase [Desulfoluna spongiiphila]|uniref:transposase n=1 Tax=Desulfoluna spongiiphila TaxID=419481 RepID=UPI00125F14CC
MRQLDTAVNTVIQRFEVPQGRVLECKRMDTTEPVFGNIRNTLGLNRFTLRGRAKIHTQWKLFAMAHNIGGVEYGEPDKEPCTDHIDAKKYGHVPPSGVT